LARGKRFQILPAISINGLLDLLVYKGSTNSDVFVGWLEKGLLPQMSRFPGPNSILVMDNASIHHDARIQALCQAAGVLLWFLPPYSPDFNPIEAFCKDLKTYIRKHYDVNGGDRLDEAGFEAFVEAAAWTVAKNKKGIEGHFRTAHLDFRAEGIVPDYAALYVVQLDEYLQTMTVG
jgi:transposase